MNAINQDLDKVTELISLPEVYLKVRRLMDDPMSEIGDFANVVRMDPGLSSKVLKVVNSAFYGFPTPIENMLQAVNMIGIAQLHNMVLSVSAISALNLPNEFVSMKALWRSSLLCGVLSRQLAGQLNIRQGERLYIVGLLHEIGHLLMYSKFPEQSQQVFDLVQQQGKSIHEAEDQIFGCHYGQIGEKLMKNWNLAPAFMTLTSFQPTPLQATSETVETALLHLSHGFAYQHFIDKDKAIEDLIQPEVWALLDLTPEQVKEGFDLALTISADMERVLLN